MHNPNIKIYEYLIIYIILILLLLLFTSKFSLELSREWNFSYLTKICWYHTAISINMLSMSFPYKNFTCTLLIKCTLLLERSTQTLIDYHTMHFPLSSSFIIQSMQERVDTIIKVQNITNFQHHTKSNRKHFAFFLWECTLLL